MATTKPGIQFRETLFYREKSTPFLEGRIQVYRLPDGMSEQDYKALWLPETDGKGKILRPARLSAQERAHYLDYETENDIMQAGRAAALSYIGSSTGSTTQWAQYFAVGTGAISGITPQDTSLANEVFRKAQTSFAVNGTTVDINFQFGTTDAQTTYTNAGLWGNGASGTLGSGTLYTHALFAYSKGAYAIAIDYLVDLF